MDTGKVEFSANDGIGRIRFYHPKSNALPSSLLAQLAHTITQAGQASDIQVIVLESQGERAFCAGASFDELMAIQNEEDGKDFFMGFARVINAARKCPKLIIGRVQGKAVGGGVGMAAATDYCLATQHAAIKLSELAIGIAPFVVGPAVERKIGLSAMSQLTLDATEWKDAQWAESKGLYAGVYDDIATLDHAVNQLATQLAGSNPVAMKELKCIFWQGTDHWDTLLEERAATSGRLVTSMFTREAIAKFKAPT